MERGSGEKKRDGWREGTVKAREDGEEEKEINVVDQIWLRDKNLL